MKQKTESGIDQYAKAIDLLKIGNKLVKVFYPNMSACGGALNGYYLNKKLVFIDATYSGEQGYSSKKIYVDVIVF